MTQCTQLGYHIHLLLFERMLHIFLLKLIQSRKIADINLHKFLRLIPT